MAHKPLTTRQRKFAIECLRNGDNATAAYRATYTCEGWSDRAITTEASRVRHHPGVADAIEKGARALKAKQVRILDPRRDTREIIIKRESAIEELARIGFSNIMDYIRIGADSVVEMDLTRMTRDQAAAITEITVDFTGEGAERKAKRVKIKLGDKQTALMNLSKLLGWTEAEDDVETVEETAKGRQVKAEIYDALREIATSRQRQPVIDVEEKL